MISDLKHARPRDRRHALILGATAMGGPKWGGVEKGVPGHLGDIPDQDGSGGVFLIGVPGSGSQHGAILTQRHGRDLMLVPGQEALQLQPRQPGHAPITGAQGARKRAQGARKRAQTTETGARKQYTRDETVPRDQGTKNAQSTRKCATQAVQNGCDSTRDNQTGVLYCTVWREGVLPTTTASHCTRDAAVHKTI